MSAIKVNLTKDLPPLPDLYKPPSNIVTDIAIDTVSEKTPVQQSGSDDIQGWQKSFLLIVFSFSAFLDTFNNASIFAAIPIMTPLLQLSGGQPIWLISAYQMLMSSFLLIVRSLFLTLQTNMYKIRLVVRSHDRSVFSQ